jgi:hypothetical protein
MAVIETVVLGLLAYWAGTGVASGALQLARGTALAEGDVELAGHALARSIAAPALGVVHEGLALTGEVYSSVLALGRAAVPLVASRNGHAVRAGSRSAIQMEHPACLWAGGVRIGFSFSTGRSIRTG